MIAVSDLEVRHLLALRAVAETGTFGRAAERLGYTQSAISQQIAALERILGDPVFDRPGGPRPVELTALGELLLGHATAILDRVGTAVHDLERFRAGTTGRVDVGSFQSVLTAVVPPVLGRLRAERPDVEIRLVQEEDNDVLVEALLSNRIDVSFLLHDDPRVDGVELFVDPFVVVSRADEVGDGPFATDLLDGAPLVAELVNACQLQIDAGLRAQGVEPEVVFRTNDNQAVAAMVRAGMGQAVMPLLAVDTEDPRLAVRALDPPIPPRHISVAWRRGRALAPAAVRFVELAREVTAPLAERSLAAA